MIDLNDSMCMVTTHFGLPKTTKTLKDETQQLRDRTNSKAARVVTTLFDNEHTTAMNKLAKKAAKEIANKSFGSPEGLRSAHLVPRANLIPILKEIEALKVEFNAHVEALIQDYGTYLEADKALQGSLYNPDAYPSPGEIAEKCVFQVMMSDLPEDSPLLQGLSMDLTESVKSQAGFHKSVLQNFFSNLCSEIDAVIQTYDADRQEYMHLRGKTYIKMLNRCRVIADIRAIVSNANDILNTANALPSSKEGLSGGDLGTLIQLKEHVCAAQVTN